MGAYPLQTGSKITDVTPIWCVICQRRKEQKTVYRVAVETQFNWEGLWSVSAAPGLCPHLPISGSSSTRFSTLLLTLLVFINLMYNLGQIT